MKRLIALVFAIVSAGLSARAQWEVYDPTVHSQLISDTGQEIGKFVEVVNNQVSQIRALTEQLNEFKHYEELFGDPKAVVIPTVEGLTGDLLKTEVGANLDDLRKVSDGVHALTYNAAGLYQEIGETFTTPGGAKITRPTDGYKPFAAINRTAENYLAVAKDAAARRVAIKARIALTTDQLKAATTAAEAQKLNAVLVGLSADLASTDQEANQALASSLVQDIENRNDEKKQILAQKEERDAQFTEAVSKYAKGFRLLSAPVKFPEK